MIFVLTLQDEQNAVATNAFRFQDPELRASVCKNLVFPDLLKQDF